MQHCSSRLVVHVLYRQDRFKRVRVFHFCFFNVWVVFSICVFFNVWVVFAHEYSYGAAGPL